MGFLSELKDFIDPSPKRSATNAPNTQTATSHAIAIRAGNTDIGRIQSWAPSQTRQIQTLYEINAATNGEIYENVPGNLGGTTIQITRYDLYSARMEEAWGPEFDIGEMLCNQVNPLTIREKWVKPSGEYNVYVYSGCWFSSLGRNFAVQGDRIILVSATLQYEKKRKFI